jgi:hypothetical protein
VINCMGVSLSGEIYYYFADLFRYSFQYNINIQSVTLKTGPLAWRDQERVLFRLVFGRLNAHLQKMLEVKSL